MSRGLGSPASPFSMRLSFEGEKSRVLALAVCWRVAPLASRSSRKAAPMRRRGMSGPVLPEVPDVTGARAVLPMLVAGDHRCLTLPVEQLRSALARDRAGYVTVAERLGPDELDLAG